MMVRGGVVPPLVGAVSPSADIGEVQVKVLQKSKKSNYHRCRSISYMGG